MSATTCTVHRFSAHPHGRFGRIALDIDARQARRQYRIRRTLGEPRDNSRMWLIATFCQAVES